MPLSKDQITTLLGLVSSAESDDMDCDGCYSKIAEFAEVELECREIPEALQAIERHLQQCVCCQDEYKALLEGLRSIQES